MATGDIVDLKDLKGYTVIGGSNTGIPSSKIVSDKIAKSLGQKILDTGTDISTFFGGKGVADKIGADIARGTAKDGEFYTKEQAAAQVEDPSIKERIGSVAQLGANFLPGAGKGASILAKTAIGAGTGYLADAGSKLQDDKSITEAATPGFGTLIGGGLPLAGAATRFAGKLASEVSGSLTGQGRGGQKALLDAISAGGDRAKVARSAMRGGFTGEQIKEEANQALGSLFGKRTEEYQNSLAKITDNAIEHDITPINQKVAEGLDAFKVRVDPKSPTGLDFSQSPIRFNKKAQTDIQTIYDEMKDFGTREGDTTTIGLDSLKRAFNDLYTESGEARKFVAGVNGEVKKILRTVPEYEKMSSEYAKSTDLIKDIQKNLGLGTRAGDDLAFKKFSQVLRGDNDARSQLLKELDDASGGKLVPMVAGELSRPVLPRGLTRPLSGLFATGAGISAGSIGAALKAMMIAGAVTSPRLAGEVINAIGVSKNSPVAAQIKKALSKLLTQSGANSN